MTTRDLSGVVEFVAVVRTASFTAAATQLEMTGSAVGKSVTRLEARLGTKLLHRTTRRLTLTNDGEAFFTSALRALEELGDAEQRLTTGRSEPAGLVRIELPGAFGRRHVLPILSDLARRYSRLDFAIMFSERRADIIDEGIDLAVRIGTLDDDPDLVGVPLGLQRLVICGSPDYLARSGEPLEAADLSSHDTLHGWGSSPSGEWLLLEPNGEITRYPVQARHRLSDGEAMVAATLAGCGLCQLPTWLIGEHLQNGSLKEVLADCKGASMPIYAVRPQSRYIRPSVRAIVKALQERAQEEGSPFRA